MIWKTSTKCVILRKILPLADCLGLENRVCPSCYITFKQSFLNMIVLQNLIPCCKFGSPYSASLYSRDNDHCLTHTVLPANAMFFVFTFWVGCDVNTMKIRTVWLRTCESCHAYCMYVVRKAWEKLFMKKLSMKSYLWKSCLWKVIYGKVIYEKLFHIVFCVWWYIWVCSFCSSCPGAWMMITTSSYVVLCLSYTYFNNSQFLTLVKPWAICCIYS